MPVSIPQKTNIGRTRVEPEDCHKLEHAARGYAECRAATLEHGLRPKGSPAQARHLRAHHSTFRASQTGSIEAGKSEPDIPYFSLPCFSEMRAGFLGRSRTVELPRTVRLSPIRRSWLLVRADLFQLLGSRLGRRGACLARDALEVWSPSTDRSPAGCSSRDVVRRRLGYSPRRAFSDNGN